MPSQSIASGAVKAHFPLLDCLRGIAALIVVLYHEEQCYGSARLFGHAYLAVDFFFMLSGFVIASGYDARFAGGLTVGAFMRARVRRLWPVLAAGVVLGAALALVQGNVPATGTGLRLIAQLLFIPVLMVGHGVFPLNAVQWSLFLELAANAVHGRGAWRWSDRTLAWVVGLAALTLFALSAYVGHLCVGDMATNWIAGVARVGFSYFAGLLLFRIWKRAPRILSGHWALPLVALPLLLIMTSFDGLMAHRAIADPLIITLIFPLILLTAAKVHVPAMLTQISRISAAWSYPLYALHLPLLGFGEMLGHAVDPVLQPVVRVGTLTVIFIITIGWQKGAFGSLMPARLKPIASAT